jgi:uncharacterized membrane protein YqgA involved in biofilm formation
MTGIGTIVNTAAVILGSLIGLLLKKGIPERVTGSVMKALGVATMFIGIGCTLSEMLVIGEDGKLGTEGIMMMIISLALGALVGELLRIEEGLDKLGEKLKNTKLFRNSKTFSEGFITATLVVCVGAMAIVGSLRDGMLGDPTMLYSKSALDFISTMMFASALGIGVLLSAVPMALYQGGITLLAGLIGGFFTDSIISNLSLVGSVLIFGVGVNLVFGKKLKVGNMLPALLVPILYGILELIKNQH